MMNRNISIMLVAVMAIGVGACRHSEKQTQSDRVFSKGNKITNNNFTGAAWLNLLIEADTSNNTQVGSVTFEPGARSNWHYHPGGQILLIIEGKGLYQEKGKSVEIIQKGDAIKCPPNVHHWHGATPTDTLVQIAVTTNVNGRVVWLEPVSEDEYNAPPKGKD